MAADKDNSDLSSSDSQGQEYELDLPTGEHGPSAGNESAAGPGKNDKPKAGGDRPSRGGDRSSTGTNQSDEPPDGGAYELEEPEEEPSSAGATSSYVDDPRSTPEVDSGTGEGAKPVTEREAEEPGESTSTSERPKSSVYTPEGEADSIDPEVARMRREDQRTRAAQQEAAEDAKRLRRWLIIGGSVIGAVILVIIIMNLT